MIEVKDWKLENIRPMDKLTATLQVDGREVRKSNPLEQAKQYAFGVCRLLESDPALVGEPGSSFQGKLAFPWGYGVVLANISRKAFAGTDLGNVISPERVICQDEMVESVDAEAFQQRLWGMLAVPDIVRVMDLQQEQLARSMGGAKVGVCPFYSFGSAAARMRAAASSSGRCRRTGSSTRTNGCWTRAGPLAVQYSPFPGMTCRTPPRGLGTSPALSGDEVHVAVHDGLAGNVPGALQDFVADTARARHRMECPFNPACFVPSSAGSISACAWAEARQTRFASARFRVSLHRALAGAVPTGNWPGI